MDKLKNLISPGKDKDDSLMYRNDEADPANNGKVSGQGSHFQPGGSANTPAGASNTTGSTGMTGQGTSNPTGSSNMGGSSLPHRGVGEGAAGVAADNAWKSRGDSSNQDVPGAFPSDSNPYKTSNLDPRVDSGNRGGISSSQATPSQPSTRTDQGGPRSTGNYGGAAGSLPEHEKQGGHSNLGRDAGLGAGAIGGSALGAHEYEKHSDGRSANPTSSSTTGNPTTTTGTPSTSQTAGQTSGTNNPDSKSQWSNLYDRTAAVMTGSGTGAQRGAAGHDTSAHNTSRMATDTTGQTGNNPMGTNDSNRNQHHAGEAAGAAGVGAAALGAARHEENKHDRNTGTTGTGNTGTGPTGTGAGQSTGHGSDFHTPWHAEPGDPAREHGKDSSDIVHPTEGSAKAPEFLEHINSNQASNEPSGVAAGSDRPTHDHSRAGEAAAGAGALGAGGVAAHEYEKHHDRNAPTTTGGQHPSVSGTQGSTGYNQPTSGTHDHHLGRDAALAGGGAAATGGAAHEFEKHHHQHQPTGTQGSTGYNQPMSGTQGSTGYNQPMSGTQGSTGYNQPTSGTHDHHLGRDAALVGGGAAATGGAAHEYEKHHHQHHPAGTQNTTQATGTEQPTFYNQATSAPTGHHHGEHHHGRDAALAGGGAAAAGGAAHEHDKHHHHHHPTDSRQPMQSTQQPTGYDQPTSASRDHHLGRDAALVGGGAAATGGAAHEYEKHHHGSNEPRQPTQPVEPRAPVAPKQPHQAHTGTGMSHTHDPTHDRHLGRDAALGAGVGAAGYEAHKHHDRDEVADRMAPTGTHEPSHVGRNVGYGAATGAGAGYAGHELSEKEAAKEQKHHDKALAKEEKHHEKEIAKEEKHHDKHAKTHEHEHEKEKKPGLLDRLLHRHKDDKEDEPTHDNHRGLEAAGGAAAVGGAGYEYEKHHGNHGPNVAERDGHNVLHKDPPQGYSGNTTGADGRQSSTQYGDAPSSGYGSGITGGTGNSALAQGNTDPGAAGIRRNVDYAEPPTKGYASQVTGGTGTTALAQGEENHPSSHLSTAGNIIDPSVKDRQTIGANREENMSDPAYRDTVTGGTGRTDMAQGQDLPTGSHMTAAGSVVDPNVSHPNKVTNPMTGVPTSQQEQRY